MGKIRVTHYRIVVTDHENAPEKPFSVAVLADMHNEVYHSDAESLISEIGRQKVRAVFSVGDLLVSKGNRCAYDVAIDVLKELTQRYPVYASNGNHEVRMRNRPEYHSQYLEYERQAREAGVVLLNNEKVSLNMEGMRIGLYGLEIDNGYYRKNLKPGQVDLHPHKVKPPRKPYLTEQAVRKLIGRPRADEYTILLAHYPRYFPTYAEWGADLTLSGHIHGGIVRLPLIGGIVGPDPCLFPHYDHGEYRIGGREMIISAGLGTHTINLRINNPAELVILDFAAGKS